jgi:hypothetical protein
MLLIDSTGTPTIPGDTTMGGNFQVNGTVVVINTEIIITDQLEINQTDATQSALIASQDNAAATETVVKFENASSSNHAFTIDRGNVGFGTTDPQAGLHVEGDIVGKLTASASNIGSTTRRIGTIYMASHINHQGNLNFNGSNVTFDSTAGRVGIGSTLPVQPLDVVGNIAGSTTITAGTGVTATTGNIVASAGSVNANTIVTAGTGVTATTGNIVATAGAVSANTTVTAGTGVIATTGNIVATAGAVSANTTVTAGGLIHSTGGGLQANTTLQVGTTSYLIGNVGVGTTAGSDKVYVYESSGVSQSLQTDEGNYTNNLRFRYGVSIGGVLSVQRTTGPLYVAALNVTGSGGTVNLSINGTPKLTATTTGVGIGTAPAAIFHTYQVGGFARFEVSDIDTTVGLEYYYGSTVRAEFTTIRTSGNYTTTIGGYTGDTRIRSGAGASAIMLKSSGRVGIGTDDPNDLFHISSSTAGVGRIRIEETGVTGSNHPGVVLYNENTYEGGFTYNESADHVEISSGFGGGLIAIEIDSTTNNVNFTKIITESSDERLKENVVPITGALNSLGVFSGIRFTWKDRDTGPQIGIIAQELEKVYPELVKSDKEGFKSIAYGNLVSVLIEAIKELEERVLIIEKTFG